MVDTVLTNPVTGDLVTLHSSLPGTGMGALVFPTWHPAGAATTVRPNTVHGFRNASASPAILRGMQAAAGSGRTTAAGLPRDPWLLARRLLDADVRVPGLPMGVQSALFRALAALAPTATH